MTDTTTDLPENPLEVLAAWAAEAERRGEPSPRTMTFATADAAGVPHARTVLTTVIDDDSVRFHSSAPTTKTTDLSVNPHASGVFYWPGLARQVTLHGTAQELPSEVSRAAYPTRPPQLRLLAWVYDELGDDAPVTGVDPGEVQRVFETHAAKPDLTMPSSWTSIRLVPEQMMFWTSHGPERAPTRVCYDRADDGTWRHRYVLP